MAHFESSGRTEGKNCSVGFVFSQDKVLCFNVMTAHLLSFPENCDWQQRRVDCAENEFRQTGADEGTLQAAAQ